MSGQTTDTVSQLTKEELPAHLRRALNHLRDPGFLRTSPLATLCGVANRHDTPAALRRILIEAINSLKPEAGEPPESRAWRHYEALYYRYVQDSSQLEIADQLGLSPRQLRREYQRALEALAAQLWTRYGTEAHDSADSAAATTAPGKAIGVAIHEELAWLQDAPADSPADLAEELPAVLELARPLVARHGVDLDVAAGGPLPLVAANPVAVRQTLLSLLGVAIRCAPPGTLAHLSWRATSSQVEIRVACQRATTCSQTASEDDTSSLEMAQHLATLCQGRLDLSTSDKMFEATLTLPAVGQVPVLAIDDNVGTLNLLQRYVSGTRYRLYGTQSAEQALCLAGRVSPQIIVLDVMMPSEDGWLAMGRLRQHPLTGHVPIIVCTILAERELALSLGAADFLRKPVSRRDFLAALDRQLSRTESGSH